MTARLLYMTARFLYMIPLLSSATWLLDYGRWLLDSKKLLLVSARWHHHKTSFRNRKKSSWKNLLKPPKNSQKTHKKNPKNIKIIVDIAMRKCGIHSLGLMSNTISDQTRLEKYKIYSAANFFVHKCPICAVQKYPIWSLIYFL
jgi:hypothetical protein